MFDAIKNLANLPALMGKAKELQEKMKQVQERLATQQTSADVGGGLVTAIVNGRMELVKLRIDREKVDFSDVDMLEDLIVAAVHAAQVRSAEAARNEMSRLASEMGLPPGMFPGM